MQSWECQGRQEHGRFGSGTCEGLTIGPVADCPACSIKAAAHTVVGLLPRAERASYESWLHRGGLRQLEQTVPDWVADARLDAETFRVAHFGVYGSAGAAGAARDFALFFTSKATGASGRAAMAATLMPLVRTAGARREITPQAPRTPGAGAGLNRQWLDTAEKALRDPRSNAYDAVIRQEIMEYDRRFAGTPGYNALDFKLIKAMLLVETGPEKPEWLTRPIQIGNTGDPGLDVLLHGAEGSTLIMRSELLNTLRANTAQNNGTIRDPALNIRAGIAYVLTRLAQTNRVSTIDFTDQSRRFHFVQSGDSLAGISRNLGTTLENPRQNNPGMGDNLRVGQVIAYQKAAVTLVISGWRNLTADSLMIRYNGNRDGHYANKIRFIAERLAR